MANYRYTDLAAETVEWTTSKGAAIKVTVNLTQKESDAAISWGVEDLNLSVSSWVNGTKVDNKIELDIEPARVESMPHIVAKLGKIGLTEELLDKVMDAANAVKSHPAYQEKMDAEARGEQASKEYDAHQIRVESLMTLNGRSY